MNVLWKSIFEFGLLVFVTVLTSLILLNSYVDAKPSLDNRLLSLKTQTEGGVVTQNFKAFHARELRKEPYQKSLDFSYMSTKALAFKEISKDDLSEFIREIRAGLKATKSVRKYILADQILYQQLDKYHVNRGSRNILRPDRSTWLYYRNLIIEMGGYFTVGELNKNKIEMEELIGSNQDPANISYNPKGIFLQDNFLHEKMQCYSGTLLFHLIQRYRSIDEFNSNKLVVIFESGHILPGYFEEVVANEGAEPSFNLIGIETTVLGLGKKNYGAASALSAPIRVLDGHLYALSLVLRDRLTNPKTFFKEALEYTAKKYSINLDQTEAEIKRIREVYYPPTKKNKSGSVAAGKSSVAAIDNWSIFGFQTRPKTSQTGMDAPENSKRIKMDEVPMDLPGELLTESMVTAENSEQAVKSIESFLMEVNSKEADLSSASKVSNDTTEASGQYVNIIENNLWVAQATEGASIQFQALDAATNEAIEQYEIWVLGPFIEIPYFRFWKKLSAKDLAGMTANNYLRPGQYLFSYFKAGYIDEVSSSLVEIEAGESYMIKQVMSKELGVNEIRIVLSWNDRTQNHNQKTKRADLDAILTINNQETEGSDVILTSSREWRENFYGVRFDQDAKSSSQSETMTIFDFDSTGTYTYAFRSSPKVSHISKLGGIFPEVKLYSGSQRLNVIGLPELGKGFYPKKSVDREGNITVLRIHQGEITLAISKASLSSPMPINVSGHL